MEGRLNRYDRYPGDYLRDTLSLTLAQDGAYTRLLDVYYSSESPIPDEDKFSLARCRSKADEKITQWVLDRFFVRQKNGEKLVWIHAKCEREIAKASTRIEASRRNGGKGGRPRNDSKQETQQVISRKPRNEPREKLPSPSPSVVATATTMRPPLAAESLDVRAQRILDNPHDATWNEPKHWPEVLQVAKAHAEAQGLGPPRLLSYASDNGIKKLVELFAAGCSPDELVVAVTSRWFVDGRKGLVSLSPTVIAKSKPHNQVPDGAIVLPEASKWE